MLAKDEIIKIARMKGLRPDQAEKEYLLHICLRNIYSGENADKIIFKGGTALRLLYGIERFSEDLDFNSRMGAGELEKAFREAVGGFREYGVGFDIIKSENFESGCSLKVRLEGPLYNGDERSRNRIRIDAGYRSGTVLGGEWKMVRQPFADVGAFQVKAMRIEEMLAEKVSALLERKKGRDLYDVWALMGMGIDADAELVSKKAGKRQIRILGKEEYLRDMRPLVSVVPDYEQVRGEVEEFIRKKLREK